ncbi:recombinase family protein [Enterococcus sp. AZ196]|uniref:recombinase family protein n=1 Tax=Enterococcus sp. AZ196 TaxID=2774659 RepID=UPI003D26C1EE
MIFLYAAYLRVSTSDQSLGRQKEILSKWQLEKNIADEDIKLFSEKVSGKTIDDRKELLRLLEFLRERDTLVVTSLDRLGRNSTDIKDILQQVRSKGANIDILDFPSFAGINDTSLRNLLTNLVIEVFSYTAESERIKTLERQQQGIALAKENGIYKGRPLKYHSEAKGADKLVYDRAVEMLASACPIATIARELSVPRKTIYAIKERLGDTSE